MQLRDAPVAYLVLLNRSPDQWCAVIDQQRKVIGRSRQCEIPLPREFPHVSRRHAEIYADRCGIIIRDLGSRSGTNINGVWIERHQEASLILGDRVWMGGVELEVVSAIPVINQVLAEAKGRMVPPTYC